MAGSDVVRVKGAFAASTCDGGVRLAVIFVTGFPAAFGIGLS